jgi:hypothetical protein
VQQLSSAIFKLSEMKGKAVTLDLSSKFFYDEFHHPEKILCAESLVFTLSHSLHVDTDVQHNT